MREETLEAVWARHQRMGDATRAAAAAWGLKLLCQDSRWNSNALTVVQGPPGVDTNDIVKTAFHAIAKLKENTTHQTSLELQR